MPARALCYPSLSSVMIGAGWTSPLHYEITGYECVHVFMKIGGLTYQWQVSGLRNVTVESVKKRLLRVEGTYAVMSCPEALKWVATNPLLSWFWRTGILSWFLRRWCSFEVHGLERADRIATLHVSGCRSGNIAVQKIFLAILWRGRIPLLSLDVAGSVTGSLVWYEILT